MLPGRGGVTGWAALRWAGAMWFDGTAADGLTTLPVPLMTGDALIRPQAGFVVSEEHWRSGDLMFIDGLPVTCLERAVTYEMRYAAHVRAAVRALDMAAHYDLVSIEEAAAYAETLWIWTGIPQCREALLLADENTWSPRETDTRLVWLLDAELPRPLTNRPVFDRRGRHLATPDLLDVEAGLAIEYDGAVHLSDRRRRRDRERRNRLRDVGVEMLTVVSADFADRWRLAEQMREARRRAPWEASSRRQWTIELPPRWVSTFTVRQRRDLDQATRERWVRRTA